MDATGKLATIGKYASNVDGLADYVHATVTGQGPVPRIPPLRVLGGIEAQSDTVSGRVEVEHTPKQERIADLETVTQGYTMVHGSLSLSPFGADNRPSLLLRANNLLDGNARSDGSRGGKGGVRRGGSRWAP